MPAYIWLDYLAFFLYLLVGPVAWGAYGVILLMAREKIRLLRHPLPATDPPPRVTVLVPAKDEGPRMRDCLVSILQQDHPNFSIIAIDDRSTDDTGAIMDDLAAAHPDKLRVLHIPPHALPENWTGKCNALHTAIRDGSLNPPGEEWLLFVDSDVILQPNALSVTLARAQRHDYDLLSLLTRIESHTFFEGLIVPLAGAAVITMYAVAFTNKDHLPTKAFANGQFLLIRRRVYDAIGGHAAVHDRFCEDVELARIAKARGHRVRIAWGADYAAVRMYSSLSGIFRGWSRNFYAASLGRPWRILAAFVFLLFCCLSAVAAVGWGTWHLLYPFTPYGALAWYLAAGAHIALMTSILAGMYITSGNPGFYAALFPLSTSLLAGILLRALQMCATGRVEWRGTRYTHRMTGNVVNPTG